MIKRNEGHCFEAIYHVTIPGHLTALRSSLFTFTHVQVLMDFDFFRNLPSILSSSFLVYRDSNVREEKS
jgi:hypothetical protein